MKISKQSWHYRLLFKLDLKIPNNLCGYFWKVVRTILICVILSPLLVIAGVGLLVVGGIVWLGDRYGWWKAIEAWQTRRYLRKVQAKEDAKRKATEAPPKQPSLFVAWLKAKKQKICPLLEFVDGDANEEAQEEDGRPE